MSRVITYAEAICEATDQCLGADANVYVMGLGVPDPKGVFGTTLGLKERQFRSKERARRPLFGEVAGMDMLPVAARAIVGQP